MFRAVAATLGLFIVWSNSFVAIGYLLGSEGAPARFDWAGLTAGRFLPSAAIAGAYLLLFRRREAAELARAEWRRLLVCGAVVVPGYNFSLYYGQQSGVPAPIASLTTALLPLFVMVLAALFLREALTRQRVIGFAVAAAGMTLIAGWLAVGYLVLPCTIAGFAAWTWLLRRLPATTVGFTVFLNPPLTALSKIALAALFPATFVFAIAPREWAGGLLALAGLAIAVWRRRPRSEPERKMMSK